MGRRTKRARRAAGAEAATREPSETTETSEAGAPPDEAGPAPAIPCGPLAEAGMRQAASSVQDVHRAIATSAFDAMQTLPMLSLPSRIAQGVHDAVSEAMYAGMRHGGSALSSVAAGMQRAAVDAVRSPDGLRQSLQAAVGDALNGTHPLAVGMRMLVGDANVLGNPTVLRSLGRRVAVFLHGLGADEHSWSRPHAAWETSAWAGRGAHYGDLLRQDEGLSPVFVRYNTSVSIEENGAQLSARLDELVRTASQVERLVIVGHSMGGLVACSAVECGRAQGAAWIDRTALIVCLGSPRQGAPLEQWGRLASAALAASAVARPRADSPPRRSRLARGRTHGLPEPAAAIPIPLRFISANLAEESHGPAGELVGHLLGDGLVARHGARDADRAGEPSEVELGGLGHMALLHHPRVYVLIRDWIRAELARPD